MFFTTRVKKFAALLLLGGAASCGKPETRTWDFDGMEGFEAQ
jgi:hypothetical protein